MCGISGLVGHVQPGLEARLCSLLRHRGPDGEGFWSDPSQGVLLCQTRLSILDLTQAAAQPMKSPDGSCVLVYNGEIYNFKELRQELESKGERLHSTGDTEVLLRGLVRDGEKFIGRLNGIFAFALW